MKFPNLGVYTQPPSLAFMHAQGTSSWIEHADIIMEYQRVSLSYPSIDDIDAYPDEEGNVPASFDALDAEGRGLVVDFGLFVLINVYCPNETSDARTSFKMNYHLLVEERVKQLMREGREVIVLGDMNICATPMDHCDGHLPSNTSNFWEHPARAWFHKWLDPLGPMTDVVRTYWPDRKGLYTCWNQKISARESNYGTRVDYILVTKGLLRWIKHGDIQASLKGSDHCPIYIDLNDEITLDSGEVVTLCNAMQQGPEKRQPPRIAANHWEEFSGKQTLLSTFFGKGAVVKPKLSERRPGVETQAPDVTKISLATPSPPEAGPSRSPSAPSAPPVTKPIKPDASRIVPNPTKKRKSADSVSSSSKKLKKQESGQASLSSFFSKPKPSKSSKDIIDVDADASDGLNDDETTLSQMEADYRLALELSASANDDATASPSSSRPSSQSKAAWSTLFTPIQPPKCTIHSEPTKKFTVNKTGPNKGRTFYLCSRPVGPGWDKGKSERLRDEVDHRYRCNYFKWASDVKRDAGNTNTVSEGNVTYIGN
ncbi:hypothetical protein EUX98_g2152 [Antrodiella citrinella]|uniref:DNA-(apurinic or apyrimidinic site) endonuclease n=1 Tax=Antrodiella citrinella TaxID=2447956 RepID=A0A4S4MZS0_9APHY|nr:hypothetical protein EUX98_g2152 [Antrodiella citrinella]